MENNKASASLRLLEYFSEKLDTSLEYLLETKKQQAEKYCALWLIEMENQSSLKNIERVVSLHKNIEDLANDYELIDILGRASLILARTYSNLKEYDESLVQVDNSIFYFTQIKNYKYIVLSLINQGHAYYYKELYEVALHSYQKALSFYSYLDNDDFKIKGDILFNLAACYNAMKEKNFAVKYAKEVCKIDEKLQDSKIYANSLLKYSSTLIRDERYTEAKEILLKAKNVLETERDEIIGAKLENNLGYIFLQANELDLAYKHLEKAKEMKMKMDSNELPATLYELFKYYLKIGDEEKALDELNKAITFCRKNSSKEYLVEGISLYSDFLLNKGDFENSIKCLQEIIELLEEREKRKDLLNTYLKLGSVLKKIGEKDEALIVLDKAYELSNLS